MSDRTSRSRGLGEPVRVPGPVYSTPSFVDAPLTDRTHHHQCPPLYFGPLAVRPRPKLASCHDTSALGSTGHGGRSGLFTCAERTLGAAPRLMAAASVQLLARLPGQHPETRMPQQWNPPLVAAPPPRSRARAEAPNAGSYLPYSERIMLAVSGFAASVLAIWPGVLPHFVKSAGPIILNDSVSSHASLTLADVLAAHGGQLVRRVAGRAGCVRGCGARRESERRTEPGAGGGRELGANEGQGACAKAGCARTQSFRRQ